MAEEKTTAGGQTMSDYWKDAWQQATIREADIKGALVVAMLEVDGLKRRLDESDQKLGNVLADLRCFMDETEMDGEGALSRQLRKHVWNDTDKAQMLESRGIIVCE